MKRNSTPHGLVVLTVVAFLIGVFVPTVNLQANISGNSGTDDDTGGGLTETHGPGGFPDGSSGGGGPNTGREADPDWPTPGGWSIDFQLVSSGNQDQDVHVPVIGPLGQLFDWVLHQVDSRYLESIYTTVMTRR